MQGLVTKLERQSYEIGHSMCHTGHYVEHRRLGEAAVCLFIHQPSEEFPYRGKQQGTFKDRRFWEISDFRKYFVYCNNQAVFQGCAHLISCLLLSVVEIHSKSRPKFRIQYPMI